MRSLSRLYRVWRLEVGHTVRRPMVWILVLLMGLTVYGLSEGAVRLQAGDSAPGEAKAWLTSEFAVAQVLSLVVFLLYSFFIAVAAGMVVINDDELQVRELLHAAGLRAGEYVWGKFLGVLTCFITILVVQLAVTALVLHGLPGGNRELRGPFVLMNYLRPALVLSVPMVVFLAGACFLVGALGRRPILV